MILPPLTNDCNARFPVITHLYFDDHQVRRQHRLQQRLKQHTPLTLDGGHAILWFCHVCQKPWYEIGRTGSLVCLSTSQLAGIARQVGAEAHQGSAFPVSICPLCASLHLGGMPRIEEYPGGQGYRLSWEAITLRKTRLCCMVYTWNVGSISNMLREACATHCDVMTSPLEHVKRVLAWLKTLAEPGKEEVVLLNESLHNQMSRIDAPPPGCSWCGYGWKAWCPVLGQVLVALGITFPTSSICSPGLLVACWRQIARQIEGVLAC